MRYSTKNYLKYKKKLDLYGKNILVICNLYWEQTIQIENKFKEYTKIERTERQDCVFSLDVFNRYSEMILREQENLPAFIIGRHNLNNTRYTDDADDRFRRLN